MNGTRKQAKYTYEHMSEERRSVIDLIRTDEETYHNTTDIDYSDLRDDLQTDHINSTNQNEHEQHNKKKKEKQTKKTHPHNHTN